MDDGENGAKRFWNIWKKRRRFSSRFLDEEVEEMLEPGRKKKMENRLSHFA